ncbi:MAG: VWA domain-containing protein [Acidobacteria bacterium]|nr:VWA domain-containing protein [Acidobacteriota bacterium]
MKPILTLALLLSAGAAQAQQTPPADDQTPLMETIDIRVINVDAVVTDRKGNPVTGLTRDDFEIYENGQPQRITNFYEVNLEERDATVDAQGTSTTSAEAPASLPERETRRKIVFFVDNLSLSPFNRNRVFEAMQDFVDEVMRPGDEGMVAAWNRSMKVRVPFTQDTQQIKLELEAMKGESGLGVHYQSEKRQIENRIREAMSVQDAIVEARSWAMSVEHDLRTTVGAVNSLLETLGGVDGKKIMVMTTEGFYMSPGREAFAFIDEMKREKPEWGAYGSSGMFEGMGFNASHEIRSLATTANANDVTLYTVHAAGLVGMSSSSAENMHARSVTVDTVALTNSTESLQFLAEMTGGVATVGTNNFRRGFDTIKSDLSSYYSLGYRSTTQRIDRQRNLEVRMKDRNLRVRARRTFIEKSIETEMRDKVLAKVFYSSDENDLGIVLRTGKPSRSSAEIYTVPLEVMIPIDKLTMLPAGDTHRGSFTLWLVVADDRGDTSDVVTQQHSVVLTDEQLESLKGKYYTYAVDLRMRKGRHVISAGVLDGLTKSTGFRQQPVYATSR